MLVVIAPSEQSQRERLAENPWMHTGILRNLEIYPFDILLGKYPEHNFPYDQQTEQVMVTEILTIILRC